MRGRIANEAWGGSLKVNTGRWAAHCAGIPATSGAAHTERRDVQAAISEAVNQAQQTIISAYHRATMSPRENLFTQVLLSCALAPCDDLGYFSAADVRDPMSWIMGRPIQIPQFARHLNDFCEQGRGPVLQKTGPSRRQRFRFLDPLLEPFIIMNGLSRGLISADILDQVTPVQNQ